MTDSAGSGVRLAAMNLLARREHSLAELCRKLSARFEDPAKLEAELLALQQEGLQSDARYAESLLRQRVSRGYGPLRIRREMRQKALSPELIEQAFEAAAVDWEGLAAAALVKKYGAGPPSDIRERARRVRFLENRGFLPEHYAGCREVRRIGV